MAIAYNRKFGTAYEVVGTGKMHSTMWGDNCWALDADPVDMLEVVILRNVAGEMLVCPANELDALFIMDTPDA